ncbi:MAG: toast rack family protein [Bryobacteraceae bacterium]
MYLLSGILVLALAGCVLVDHSGPAQHETKSIPLDKAEMVRAEIKIGAGNLKIRGGSSQLVDTDFTYNVPSWKPEVRYDSSGFRGRLTIEQPGGNHNNFGKTKYEWDLRFNNDVPLSLNVHFGAGNAELDLGSLTLDQLAINMGVGNLRLDLKGNPKKDYQVGIHGGVGNATVYLPDAIGVVAEAHGGIGSVDARDLHKRGDRYVNDAYENHAKVTVRLDIHGGIGSVHLIGG